MLSLLPLIFFFSALLFAQIDVPPAGAAQAGIQEHVTVTLKLVRVWVTDKKGSVVTDLRKEDFELLDNSKPVPIAAFEKYVANTARQKSDVHREAKPAGLAEKSGRKIVFFFDLAFGSRLGIEKSRQAALHFFDNFLLPTDDLLIASYSAIKGVVYHAASTSDHGKSRDVLTGFAVGTQGDRAKDVEEEYWELKTSNKVTRSRRVQDPLLGDYYRKELEIERLIYLAQVHDFLAGMEDWADLLGKTPGHKHIFLFSSGIPGSVLYDTQASSGLNKEADLNKEFAVWRAYEGMIRKLAASGSSVYVFDLGELSSVTPRSVTTRGVDSLNRLTEVSGGKYYKGLDNFREHMREVQTITGSYYVLGFYIGRKGDGKFHSLKVKVKRKGCLIHTSSGYFQ